MQEVASIDGVITLTAEAKISVVDPGLIRGDGAFERIAVYGGRPFALQEHLERLDASTVALDLAYDRQALESEFQAVLERCGPVDAAIRIVLTRGGRRIVLLEKVEDFGSDVSLKSVTYAANVILNGVKSISYAANMSATRRAVAAGYGDALLVSPHNYVLEAPTASIFWADSEGLLYTPELELGILASIRRQKLVAALDVQVGRFTLDKLTQAKEAFITSSTRGVQPVSRIDEIELKANPGPMTKQAHAKLKEFIAEDLSQYSSAHV